MTDSAKLESKAPTLLTGSAFSAITLWGLLMVLPVLLAMMMVSLLQFGLLTFLVPLATIAVTLFLLPLGFGNWYVARLVRPLRPAAGADTDLFLVQLTCQPRMRAGLSAILDDADDLGFLSFDDSKIVFVGDSVRLSVPFDRIREMRRESSGWRALFAYGPRSSFSVEGLPAAGRFAFAERSSWHLAGSRRNARRMHERLRRAAKGSKASEASRQI